MEGEEEWEGWVGEDAAIIGANEKKPFVLAPDEAVFFRLGRGMKSSPKSRRLFPPVAAKGAGIGTSTKSPNSSSAGRACPFEEGWEMLPKPGECEVVRAD